MTLLTDSITVVPTTTVNHPPQYIIRDVHKPCYGGSYPQPDKSWARGEVALVDPITGYEYCPIVPGQPGAVINDSGEWLAEITQG